MNRIDRLQENQLTMRLTALRQQIDSLKNAQILGSKSVVIRRIATANTVDFSATLTYHHISIFEVTITPTDTAFTDGNFIWETFYNAVTTSGTGTAQVYTELLPVVNGVRKSRFYGMGMSPSASVTYGVKVVIYMIGNANLSIVQIA